MLGYNTWLFKYLCFVLSGLLAAVAGVLNAYYLQFVSVGDLSVVLSAEALLMVILGGPGTLLGPVLGAFVLVLLRNIISGQHIDIGPFNIGERWTLILGVIYILVVLFAPRGLVGEVLGRVRGRRAAGRLVTLASEEPSEVLEIEPQPAIGTHGAAGR
jgi:branched-chain amino acid transport system permease protein